MSYFQFFVVINHSFFPTAKIARIIITTVTIQLHLCYVFVTQKDNPADSPDTEAEKAPHPPNFQLSIFNFNIPPAFGKPSTGGFNSLSKGDGRQPSSPFSIQ